MSENEAGLEDVALEMEGAASVAALAAGDAEPTDQNQERLPEFAQDPDTRQPDASDAAEFVKTNPSEALAVHAVLNQALIDAGHIAPPPALPESAAPVPDENLSADTQAVALLGQIRGFLNQLPQHLQADAHALASRLRHML